jgi:SAM-dependent methyltransferase
MEPSRQTRVDQSSLWNGRAGCAWVDTQTTMDQVLAPFERLLVDAVSARSPRRVLDVGCGTGSTTLAAARVLETTGDSVGVDISKPMIVAARSRAEREGSSATFIRADAQLHRFEPASFDMIISRFGVMFFEDPVQAFANLRRAARNGAELRFVAWRTPEENPFMTTAERAAAPLLPNLPPRRPDVPGPFSLADPQRVHAILQESGWAEIDLQPIDVACTLPAKELTQYVSRLGPVGLALDGVDARTHAQVVETARAAFAPYVDGDEVRFTGACWMVSARRRRVPSCLVVAAVQRNHPLFAPG